MQTAVTCAWHDVHQGLQNCHSHVLLSQAGLRNTVMMSARQSDSIAECASRAAEAPQLPAAVFNRVAQHSHDECKAIRQPGLMMCTKRLHGMPAGKGFDTAACCGTYANLSA